MLRTKYYQWPFYKTPYLNWRKKKNIYIYILYNCLGLPQRPRPTSVDFAPKQISPCSLLMLFVQGSWSNFFTQTDDYYWHQTPLVLYNAPWFCPSPTWSSTPCKNSLFLRSGGCPEPSIHQDSIWGPGWHLKGNILAAVIVQASSSLQLRQV